MDYKTLLFEERDHIGFLTLNRPQAANALTEQLIEELRHFFGYLDDNLDIRVVVLRAAGKNFCAGLDLKDGPGMSGGGGFDGTPKFKPRGYMIQRRFSDIAVRMRHCPQPIICSQRGVAIGAGFGIVCAADIRIASETARFNVGSTRIGMPFGDAGMSYFLPRLIGASNTALYTYSARFMDAATALRLNLVSEVFPDDKLEEATEQLAQEVLKVSPFALRMSKELFNSGLDSTLIETTRLENRSQMLGPMTDDMMEAVKANYFEKRAPKYTDE